MLVIQFIQVYFRRRSYVSGIANRCRHMMEFGTILTSGDSIFDVPGVCGQIIQGLYDANGVSIARTKTISKYQPISSC